MAEYNWWDDRTAEENDDMICPIINYPCSHENCGECEDYKAFIAHYRAKEILSIIKEIKEEKVMFIEFGDSLISTSCIFGFKKCEKTGVLSEYYSIEMIFNHDNSEKWSCWEEFETKEEMEERWNELKMMLCPMKTLSCDDTVKLEKDSNPFFIHADLANGNPV